MLIFEIMRHTYTSFCYLDMRITHGVSSNVIMYGACSNYMLGQFSIEKQINAKKKRYARQTKTRVSLRYYQATSDLMKNQSVLYCDY